MVSDEHETLIELFRQRPSLVGDLIPQLVPGGARASVVEANANQLRPPEFHADLVLRYEDEDGRGVLVLPVEIQLSADGGKRFSWPIYASVLRRRHRCEANVLVVTTSATVARWVRREIRVGPGFTMRPWVLGPAEVPPIETPEEAQAAPERAVLAALAVNRGEAGGRAAFLAAVGAATVDEVRARAYYDLVLRGLDELARQTLEALMERSEGSPYYSDFANKYYGQGRQEGRQEGRQQGQAEALLTVLSALGLAVSEQDRERILAGSAEELGRWIRAAATAADLSEVLT